MKTRISRYWCRLRRDGAAASFRGVWGALRPRRFGLYRLDLPGPDEEAALPREEAAPSVVVQTSVQELCALAAQASDDELPWAFRPGVEWRTRWVFFIADGRLPGAVLWVIRKQEGSKYFTLGDDEVELGGLFVLPKCRRLGWAELLMNAAARELQARGYRALYSAIAADNIPSQRLVHKCGYRQIAECYRPIAFGPVYVPGDVRAERWGEFFRRQLTFWRGARPARVLRQGMGVRDGSARG